MITCSMCWMCHGSIMGHELYSRAAWVATKLNHWGFIQKFLGERCRVGVAVSHVHHVPPPPFNFGYYWGVLHLANALKIILLLITCIASQCKKTHTPLPPLLYLYLSLLFLFFFFLSSFWGGGGRGRWSFPSTPSSPTGWNPDNNYSFASQHHGPVLSTMSWIARVDKLLIKQF